MAGGGAAQPIRLLRRKPSPTKQQRRLTQFALKRSNKDKIRRKDSVLLVASDVPLKLKSGNRSETCPSPAFGSRATCLGEVCVNLRKLRCCTISFPQESPDSGLLEENCHRRLRYGLLELERQGVPVDSSIQHGDVDIDRTPAVAGLRAATVTINAINARRDALYGRAKILGCADSIREDFAVFGHEQHAVVGLD